jgi:hypothetical protein
MYHGAIGNAGIYQFLAPAVAQKHVKNLRDKNISSISEETCLKKTHKHNSG